ncbi:MAG TPA: F0F1 ATP synthase subunit gamma, partial [Pyrinomonadaceae bacterium]
MANLLDIRRRIKSVKNTQQITKAMKMVSAAKLKRAQERAVSARPFATKMAEVLTGLASKAGENFTHPLMDARGDVRLFGPAVLEVFEGLFEIALDVVGQGLLLAYGRQQAGMGVFDEAQELRLEAAHVLDREVVNLA